jgi:hypothetical protein
MISLVAYFAATLVLYLSVFVICFFFPFCSLSRDQASSSLKRAASSEVSVMTYFEYLCHFALRQSLVLSITYDAHNAPLSLQTQADYKKQQARALKNRMRQKADEQKQQQNTSA